MKSLGRRLGKVEENLSPEKTAEYLISLAKQAADTDDPLTADKLRRRADHIAVGQAGEKATEVRGHLIDHTFSTIAGEIIRANVDAAVWKIRCLRAELGKVEILSNVAEESGNTEAVITVQEAREALTIGLERAVRDLDAFLNSPDWAEAGVEVPEVPDDILDEVQACR